MSSDPKWTVGVRVVLDATWPRDRWREALERAVSDGHFDRAMPARRPEVARDGLLEQRLEELGF